VCLWSFLSLLIAVWPLAVAWIGRGLGLLGPSAHQRSPNSICGPSFGLASEGLMINFIADAFFVGVCRVVVSE
jgi:hypothetical protein